MGLEGRKERRKEGRGGGRTSRGQLQEVTSRPLAGVTGWMVLSFPETDRTEDHHLRTMMSSVGDFVGDPSGHFSVSLKLRGMSKC